jgi:hypothetical protein
MVMNLSRIAIRYEVNRSSAAMSLHLCLGLFALWMAGRAASDLFFVWYWTGRLGSGAHEYFGRWFLAWLFTQRLPLYFLSLPYGNGRYTIASMMYAFLNWRFYRGCSFGEWFAYYSLWVVLPASLSVGAIGYLIFGDPSDRSEGKQLRGLKLIAPRRLARDLRRTALRGDRVGVELAGVRVPRSLECEHFLITGATGSGKSMAIRVLLRRSKRAASWPSWSIPNANTSLSFIGPRGRSGPEPGR